MKYCPNHLLELLFLDFVRTITTLGISYSLILLQMYELTFTFPGLQEVHDFLHLLEDLDRDMICSLISCFHTFVEDQSRKRRFLTHGQLLRLWMMRPWVWKWKSKRTKTLCPILTIQVTTISWVRIGIISY